MGVFKANAAFAAGALLWLAVGAWLAPGASAAPQPGARVTLAADQDGLQLVILSNNKLSPKAFFLPNPNPRFVVDLPVGTVTAPAAPPDGADLARAVRRGIRGPQATRIVLDLSGEARLTRQTSAHGPDGWRVTYRLAAAQAPDRAPNWTAPTPAPVEFKAAVYQPPKKEARPKIVVVDAGHGGNDSGAVSPAGEQEKNMTLAAARALRAVLEARGYQVVLTRDSDVYIPLAERVRTARQAKADLFISLHADSSPSPSARGASIYTLSESGGARAKSLMDSQDWQVDLGEASRSARVDDILIDLTQRETTSRSTEFADTLAHNLTGVAPLIQNTHRSASFFVLLAPDVPAVLLEMGFMTNAKDIDRLADRQARARLVTAIADSIDQQFSAPAERSYAEAGAAPASFSR